MGKNKKNKASIYDIAQAVGVSPAAVSYVINGKDKVSEKTKAKILSAMAEMGYVVNQTAVSLSRGKSSLVGVCFPLNSSSLVFSDNPFYSEFLANFEKEISKNGYDTIIGYLQTPQDFERWIVSRGLDGLVLFGLYSPEIFKIILAHKVPFILTDFYDPEFKASSIRIDDEKGGYLAGKHLVELGHKNIAFIGGPVEASKVDSKRLEGLNAALKEVGLSCALHLEAPTTFDGGYNAATVLKEHPEITAVFCGSDIVAIGLMRHAQELQISIPDDLSVIGFDDLQACTYVYPALTTIRQNIPLKGQLAADNLLKAMNGEINPDPQTLTPTLVIRNSTSKPRF